MIATNESKIVFKKGAYTISWECQGAFFRTLITIAHNFPAATKLIWPKRIECQPQIGAA